MQLTPIFMKFTLQSRGSFIWIRLTGFVIAGMLFLSSCRIPKESVYFKTLQQDSTINGFVTNDFESKIRVGDQLSIVATSLSAAEDEQFNKGAAVSESPAMSGFKVQPDGTVLLHRLGAVKAAGLTRKQFATQLQQQLMGYMKEPIVNVNYLNHKVTVMGEVGGPQVLPMPEEQLSLIDVLVKSGDIGVAGLKNRVMVIREVGTTKQVKYLNLEDASILTSPWYYVQPNDIILVRTDMEKKERAERRTRTQTTIAMATGAVSFLLLVLDRIAR